MSDNGQATNPQVEKSETGVLEQLNKKSREELLFLVEQLLERKPEIKPLIGLLLELPFADSRKQEKTPGKRNILTLNLSTIRKQLDTALHSAGEGWRSASLIADELSRLCEIGNEFLNAGEFANAQAIYAMIARESIARYEELEDEWQIAAIIDDCTEGLALCLDAQDDLPVDEQLSVASRKDLLAALYDIWKFGQDYGGVDTDVVGTILRNTTNEERLMVERWLEQEIESGASNWRKQNVMSFIEKLKKGYD